MTTYEMVALADKNGKIYTNEEIRYKKDKGFHDANGATAFFEYENETDQFNAFMHDDEWEELTTAKLTLEEIENALGYKIELI